MENILESLFQKQKLLLNHITNFYEIKKHKNKSGYRIRESFGSKKIVYGKDIEQELLEIYTFGDELTKVVLYEWLASFGLIKSDKVNWDPTWSDTFTLTSKHYNRINPSITDIQRGGRYMIALPNFHDMQLQNSEVDVERIICLNVCNQLIDLDLHLAHHYLSNCFTMEDIIGNLVYMGYESFVETHIDNLRQTFHIRENNNNYLRYDTPSYNISGCL